jgi:hypothetical protein
MHEFNRRSILKLAAIFSFDSFSSIADEQKSTVQLVEAAKDRTGQPHKAAATISQLCFPPHHRHHPVRDTSGDRAGI